MSKILKNEKMIPGEVANYVSNRAGFVYAFYVCSEGKDGEGLKGFCWIVLVRLTIMRITGMMRRSL